AIGASSASSASGFELTQPPLQDAFETPPAKRAKPPNVELCRPPHAACATDVAMGLSLWSRRSVTGGCQPAMTSDSRKPCPVRCATPGSLPYFLMADPPVVISAPDVQSQRPSVEISLSRVGVTGVEKVI